MLEFLGTFIINIISSTGYLGIFLLMTLESALIPIPSEVTMPFAGSLVSLGKFDFFIVVLAGTLGNLLGSLLAYALGYWGEENVIRLVIRKYGKYFLLSEHEFEKSQKSFDKYGEMIVFLSRLLPVLRTFISLPAGIAKMKLSKFIGYTLVGSFLWSLLLTWIGWKLGQNWKILENYFHKFDFIIFISIIIVIIFYLYHKFQKLKKP